jgi:hypothetical protein
MSEQNEGTSQQGGQQQQQEGQQGLTWETWHGGLPDDQKGLIENHVSGLKSALDGERATRRDLERQVRDLASKAQAGSEAQTQLTQLADQLKAGEKQTAFYETAHASGVKNLRLAWIAAQSDAKYFKGNGSLDIDAFKSDYPELFGTQQVPPGNGGNGNGQGGGGAVSMDQIIRQAAGR